MTPVLYYSQMTTPADTARRLFLDPVSLRDAEGRELARGLSAYDADSARRIAGRRSDEIEAILGWRGRDEMVHRDDLVVF